MKRALLVNALLALLVLGLGSWMVLRPGESPSPTVPLVTLSREAVSAIRVERRGLPVFVLERQGKRWVQTAPFRARTDHAQAGRLLDLVAATSSQQLPATDLGRFELAPPATTVTLQGEAIGFGAVNPLTREQYVLAGGRVHLVPPTLAYALPTREDSLASHMLLAEDEVPTGVRVGVLEASTREGRIALSGGPSGEARLSQDDLQRWFEQWRFASSLAVSPVDRVPEGEHVRIALKDGRHVDLVIVARQPQLVLVRADERLRHTLAAEQAARLFAPEAQPAKP